jgi:hypothetical protein
MKKNLLLSILFLLAVPLVFVPAESSADTTPPTFCGIGSAICGHFGAQLDWGGCPATDDSPPITYNIYWSTVSGGQDFITPNGTTTDFVYWTGETLEAWVTYYFVVRAEDSFGNEDTNTVEMSCTTIDQTDYDHDGYVDDNWGGDDCNDLDPNINPGAVEDCTDFIDNDCDNLIDAEDPDAVGCGGPLPYTQVNTYTTGDQEIPSVAMDSNGNFVITWRSYGQDAGINSFGIYAQRYDRSGNPVGSEFQVNTYTTHNQDNPSVAIDSNGNFVITWESYGQDGDGDGVYAQMYDSSGNPVGSEFQVNTYTTYSQESSSVAMDSNGNFVIAWTSSVQDGYGHGIYAQRYDSSGNPVGSEFLVNTDPNYDQLHPSVAMDSNGNFVITWDSNLQDGDSRGVYAQMYDSSGNPVGSEFLVNTYTNYDQLHPSVAMDSNGNFVITWESNLQDGDSRGVYAQMYDS